MKKAISTSQTKANIEAVLTILTATPGELERLSAGLTPEQLRNPLGAGERSFTEDMAHLINIERSSETIYQALMLDEPLIPDLHPERDWGQLLRHDLFEFTELLIYFKFRRMLLLRVLNSLKNDQWGRTIREANKQRKESVYWRARGMALHELDHINDLKRKLGKND